MADTKISALAQLTGAASVAAADELVIVDKSDTTMAASGTDKRITAADLAQAVHEQVPEYTGQTTPAAPSTGVKLFARKRAGRRRLNWIGPSGLDAPVQAGLDVNRVSSWRANGSGTTGTLFGWPAVTAIGTATAATIATSSFLASLARLSYISAATAGSSGGVKINVLQYWLGNGAGLGGFYFCCRFGLAAIPAGWRFFCGLYGSTTNPSNADPSSQTNLIGVLKDSADAQLSLFTKGAGSNNKTASGLSAPAANEVWEVRVFSAPNSQVVDISLEKMNGTGVAEASFSTNLPASTQLLLPILWANNGATASAIDPQLVSLYVETDY